MSNLSSMSYDGPTIVPDPPEARPPLYRIDRGYPGHRAGRPDRRFDPRLKQALTAAGILREIRNSADVAPIETNFSGWHGDALGSQLAVTIFPETIRQGRDIRLVLRFAHDTKADEARMRERMVDRSPLTTSRHGRLALKVHLTLRGTGQAGTSEWVKTDFSGSDWQTTVPCRVRPWGSGTNPADIRTGPAEMAIRVEAYRHRTGADLIGSWSVPAQTVLVLPAEGGASRSGGDRF